MSTDGPNPDLASFLTSDQYEKLKYNHDAIIQKFDEALKSSAWPANDFAVNQEVMRPKYESAMLRLGWDSSYSTTSSVSADEGDSTSEYKIIPQKRSNSGSPA